MLHNIIIFYTKYYIYIYIYIYTVYIYLKHIIIYDTEYQILNDINYFYNVK